MYTNALKLGRKRNKTDKSHDDHEFDELVAKH